MSTTDSNDELPSYEKVRDRINALMDDIAVVLPDGSFTPYVCMVCDKFLKPNEITGMSKGELKKAKKLLTTCEWNKVTENLGECYKYSGHGSMKWMDKMMLSPRGIFCKKRGYIVCGRCKTSLKKGSMPDFAIANNMAVGSPPTCLLELTDAELAFLSPVKSYGFCFTYNGGKQRNLKGTLSYYKVDVKDIGRQAAHLMAAGLNEHVVIVLSGEMTMDQKQKAKEHSSVRTEKILAAVTWLCENNVMWKEVRLHDIIATLEGKKPVIIDESQIFESSEDARSLESSIEFSVYYPDESINTLTGGQASCDKFKDLVDKLNSSAFDIFMQNTIAKEAVSDYVEDNLAGALLLQYPFGRGGLNEYRIGNNDDSRGSVSDITGYVQHVSRLSQAHFHRPLCTLVLYNLYVRQRMLQMACLRLSGKTSPTNFVSLLTAEDVKSAIEGQRRGLIDGTSISRSFLSCVDAVTNSMPHSNDAARRGRTEVESLQHHMGLPTHFLTVTPDDDNSWLMQVYSGVVVDDDQNVDDLSDAELEKRALSRTKLRLSFPGIASFNFELMLDIIFEVVIGWNRSKRCPTAKNGLFGKCKAAFVCIEEQGRKSLHMHITVWIERMQEVMENLTHQDSRHHNIASTAIASDMDRIASSSLFPTQNDEVRKVFRHEKASEHGNLECPACVPKVVDDQQLRNLRHQSGYKGTGGEFAVCTKCTKFWTYEELVGAYLKNSKIVQNLSSFPDKRSRRLEALCVKYQKATCTELLHPVIINACYNSHRSCHCASCFRSSKYKSTLLRDVECRYHLPDQSRKRTTLEKDGKSLFWYKWDGSMCERYLSAIRPKRNTFDLFQNISCKAVSESIMSCNTNVAVLLPVPLPQYITKYQTKSTQDDDTEDYMRVATTTEKALLKITAGTGCSVRSDALRLVLGASFAHCKTNIVGCPMASFLTRNGRRFICSHDFVWCPLRDIGTLLHGQSVQMKVLNNGAKTFFENSALHYLCRPVELESVSAFEFYSNYEVIKNSRKRKRHPLLEFCSTDEFHHPSYDATTKKLMQGVGERERTVLIKVSQFDFPDTAQFGGSLFDSAVPTTECMEQYSRLVLILFCPLRKESDLLLNNSYRAKLQQLFYDGFISSETETFLQNLQNSRSNCLRCPSIKDQLTRSTTPYVVGGTGLNVVSVDDEEDNICSEDRVDDILERLDIETGYQDGPAGFINNEVGIPTTMSFTKIRIKGNGECGYKNIANTLIVSDSAEPFVVETMTERLGNDSQHHLGETVASNATNESEQLTEFKAKKRDIVFLFRRKEVSKRRMPATNIVAAKVMHAIGTTESIFNWARAAKLDTYQKKAFEVFVSSFLLTFYVEAESQDEDVDGVVNMRFRREYGRLKKVRRLPVRSSENDDDNLICLLHGPGGSGKSTVIDLVLAYCKEFCDHLRHPFNERTIVVCAMSGVAATLILGETAHSALLLNQKKEISSEQVVRWNDTRLIIIDEISFASKNDVEKMDQIMRTLKQRKDKKFGGLNVIFSGDFRQLDPVKAEPIYVSDHCPQLREWVNCFIELQGMHRFAKDMRWGMILKRFREGIPTLEDIRAINERIVSDESKLPEGVSYACYYNRDRDAINTASFEQHCEQSAKASSSDTAIDAVIILSDKLEFQSTNKEYKALPSRGQNLFWTECGEDDVKFKNSTFRFDPALKLYRNCPVMLTENDDVKEGKANGSRASVRRVVLKGGEVPTKVKLSNGIFVYAILAGQVSHLELQHCNNRIVPDVFTIKVKESHFETRFPIPPLLRIHGRERELVAMKGRQFPIISNTATTGHKLQGATVDNLFVHAWCYGKSRKNPNFFSSNWIYVVLSRVRTLEGLHIREKLDEDLSKYKMSEKLRSMLADFDSRRIVSFTEEDMQAMCGATRTE